MIKEILKQIIKLVPKRKKENLSNWIKINHPNIWKEATKRTIKGH